MLVIMTVNPLRRKFKMKKLFVCALAVAMVFAFTAPTLAADWNLYGSARMATFSNDVDPQVAGVQSDTDTLWALQGNARFGGTVSAGDVGGGFEYGSGPNLRKLYGTWNFGAGTLLIGQTYTPIAEFYSNQVWGSDEDLLGNGMAYHGRRAMIQLAFGGFKVAFVQPNVQATLMDSTGTAITSGDNDTTLPEIVLAYKFSSDMFSVKPYLGWSSYDFTTGVTSLTQSESVDSLVYGIGGKVNFGPGYFALNVWGGNNAGNFGMYMATDGNAGINATTGSIIDNTTLAYAGVLGFKASDMWAFEAGYGASSSEADIPGAKVEDTSFSYYINASITMAPGVFVVPEFGKYSLDELKVAGVSTKQAETTYFGAKWQINF
jgi:hypothetical protein